MIGQSCGGGGGGGEKNNAPLKGARSGVSALSAFVRRHRGAVMERQDALAGPASLLSITHAIVQAGMERGKGGGGDLFTTLKGHYLLRSFRLTTGCACVWWGEKMSAGCCASIYRFKPSEMRE